MVEVDGSDVGVGALLSKRFTEDNKRHPCAFRSERHKAQYIVSVPQNKTMTGKLLGVKLAFEGWRHWLGAKMSLYSFGLTIGTFSAIIQLNASTLARLVVLYLIFLLNFVIFAQAQRM